MGKPPYPTNSRAVVLNIEIFKKHRITEVRENVLQVLITELSVCAKLTLFSVNFANLSKSVACSLYYIHLPEKQVRNEQNIRYWSIFPFR